MRVHARWRQRVQLFIYNDIVHKVHSLGYNGQMLSRWATRRDAFGVNGALRQGNTQYNSTRFIHDTEYFAFNINNLSPSPKCHSRKGR